MTKLYKQSTHELMFYMNLAAVVFLVAASTISGQTSAAIGNITHYSYSYLLLILFLAYCQANPSLTKYLAFASLTSTAGQNFVFFTVSHFNSLVLATITTTRKFFTILLSVLYFGHRMALRQWAGVAMVFAGLGLELLDKYNKKTDVKSDGYTHPSKRVDEEASRKNSKSSQKSSKQKKKKK